MKPREMTIDDVTVALLAERQYEVGQALDLGAEYGTPSGPVLDYLALRYAVVALLAGDHSGEYECIDCGKRLGPQNWAWDPVYRAVTHQTCLAREEAEYAVERARRVEQDAARAREAGR